LHSGPLSPASVSPMAFFRLSLLLRLLLVLAGLVLPDHNMCLNCCCNPLPCVPELLLL
jgi:hypothetical protein